MDKVIIYGVYEFVGFHLCKRFLENGFYVEGIHFNVEADLFLEEKRFEVGRNANFEEKTFTDSSSLTEADVIIISLYDWFMTSKKERFTQMVEFLKEQNESQSRLVCLLPIQSISDWQGEGMEDMKNFADQIKQMDYSIQNFYLPTIFGPWQPASFLFQSALLKQEDQLEIKEWPLDAIYVEDLLAPLVEEIENGEPGSYLFESGIPKSWGICLEFLKLDESKTFDVKINNNDEIKKLVLNEVTPYEKALNAQKDHTAYINNLMGPS